MTATKQQLIPLLALPDPWAARSGLPRETVLRRLSEWAMCGAFPPGAFRNTCDDPIETFDIYMSFRAMAAALISDAAVSLGSTTIYSPRWGIDLLRSVLISCSDIEIFCEKVDAEPPWQRYRMFWLFRVKAAGRQHLAPPACPEAEGRAIRHNAGASADASMNSMRAMLDSLMGKPGTHSFYSTAIDDGPIDFDFYGKRWAEHRDRALKNIEESQDVSLHDRLNLLTQEWEEFLKAHHTKNNWVNAPAEAKQPATLRLFKPGRRVILYGKEFSMAEKPFRLLHLLAERATKGDAFVSVRDIEQHLWGSQLSKLDRPANDVVRDLREALEKGACASGRSLVPNRPGQGYRLELSSAEIAFEP
jgi:hypothetical protein